MTTEVLSARYKASKFAHSSATTAGSFYLINGRVWLALNDADANADNVFVFIAEVRGPKATGQAWTPGDAIYWHDTNGNFTTASTGATLCGFCMEAAASGDEEGVLYLTPFAVT